MGRRTAAAAPECGAATLGSNHVIFSRSGYPVDTSRSTWHVPHPSGSLKLIWKGFPYSGNSIREATEAYLKYLIANYSKGEIDNNWKTLKLVTTLPSVINAGRKDVEIDSNFFTELDDILPEHERYRLHFARKWYAWCSDAAFPPFSAGLHSTLNNG